MGAGATGAWEGRDGQLAMWRDGWHFLQPAEGWRAWDRTADELKVWAGGAWERAAVRDLDGLEGVGIGAASDAQNRLSVAAPAALFSHAGTDHRLKINKAAAADTASMLFQTGFSGRAEIGLAGSDALSVKVSPDGADWAEAVRADPASGIVSVPQGLDSVQLHIPFETVGAVATPSAGGFVFLSLVEATYPQAPANAILVYDTGSSPLLQTVWTGPAVTNRGTEALTGTTGEAGTLSVGVQSDGQLHIENRYSANLSQVCLTFINGFRPL